MNRCSGILACAYKGFIMNMYYELGKDHLINGHAYYVVYDFSIFNLPSLWQTINMNAIRTWLEHDGKVGYSRHCKVPHLRGINIDVDMKEFTWIKLKCISL
jgi:hypothetical protein